MLKNCWLWLLTIWGRDWVSPGVAFESPPDLADFASESTDEATSHSQATSESRANTAWHFAILPRIRCMFDMLPLPQPATVGNPCSKWANPERLGHARQRLCWFSHKTHPLRKGQGGLQAWWLCKDLTAFLIDKDCEMCLMSSKLFIVVKFCMSLKRIRWPAMSVGESLFIAEQTTESGGWSTPALTLCSKMHL